MTKDELAELRAMMGEVIDEKLQPIREDITGLKKNMATIKEDIAVIKEEAQITRHSTNLLLHWAERADRSLNVGLYNTDKD